MDHNDYTEQVPESSQARISQPELSQAEEDKHPDIVELHGHKIEGNIVNEKLTLAWLKGENIYLGMGADTSLMGCKIPPEKICAWLEDKYGDGDNSIPLFSVCFHTGKIEDGGSPSGWTMEFFLAIVQHRLEQMQEGSFPCEFNQMALYHIGQALANLKQRTQDRLMRGVEGEAMC